MRCGEVWPGVARRGEMSRVKSNRAESSRVESWRGEAAKRGYQHGTESTTH